MYTLAITGVGGGVGQSIIKALQESEYELIGLDGEFLGTGLYALKKSFKVPYAADPRYIETLLRICEDNNIKLLFPGLDAELEKLSQSKDQFLKIGTTVVVSNPDVVEVSENKWKTYEVLTGMGFHVPFTKRLSGDTGHERLSFPFVIKPFIGGARSKDVYSIKNKDEYDVVLKLIAPRIGNFVMQEYLPGEEYTCGTVTMGGKCFGAIVMKRELRCGDTYKCFTVEDPTITEYLVRLMNALKPFGACNVQLKLGGGVPCIFEINARCSGTTAARALCGFNEPLMVADYLLKGIHPSYAIKKKTILRYWKELEVENKAVEVMSQTGRLQQPAQTKL